MKYFKALLVYQVLGLLACIALRILLQEYDLVLTGLIAIAGYLLYLLFSKKRGLVFYSLLLLFLLQLLFVTTAQTGFSFSPGLAWTLDYRLDIPRLRGFTFSLLRINFSPADPGKTGIIGFNIPALFFIITILLTGRK